MNSATIYLSALLKPCSRPFPGFVSWLRCFTLFFIYFVIGVAGVAHVGHFHFCIFCRVNLHSSMLWSHSVSSTDWENNDADWRRNRVLQGSALRHARWGDAIENMPLGASTCLLLCSNRDTHTCDCVTSRFLQLSKRTNSISVRALQDDFMNEPL